MERFFREAYGFAVFPSVGRAGIALGGAYGKGEVYERCEFFGTTKVKQFNTGFLFGAQKYSEFIFFKTKVALEEFKRGRFKPNAQASVTIATAGASADADYSKDVAVFTMVMGGD